MSTKEDDAKILAMCDQEIHEDEPNSGLITQPSGFEMGGSTINIDRSKDIHIGPKTVASPPSLPSAGNLSSASLYSQESNCTRASADSISISSSSSVLNSQLQNFLNMSDSQNSFDATSQSSVENRSFSQNVPQSSSFTVNFSSPTPEPPEAFNHSLEKNEKLLKKSASTGTSVGNQSVSSFSSYRNQQELQPVSQNTQVNPSINRPSGAQLSAAINNSKNIQMGPQYVYNYYSYPSEDETRHQSINLSDPASLLNNKIADSDEPLKDFLLEFKKNLTSVYQKRTKSSILPWHRGQQIPINDYYTEPQIFAIDKCGRKTTETVDLISIINSNSESRFLIEGEAGMGKTLLATKLAGEWASGRHLQQFQILIQVILADFKGSLQQYVRDELLPSYFKTEKFEKVWEYCKSHEREVLFILDGFDELERSDKGEIRNLLSSKDFPESKVVVTSRPNIVQDWEKKIVVSGFGQIQVMEFIKKYFRVIGNEARGQSLMKLIEKDDKYWNLAKRPLFCVLLCMLCITGDVGESLPERQSDVMLQIILCLIKWNGKNNQNSAMNFDSLPQEYEKPFNHFGKLCLNALKTEKSRFTDLEVKSVEGFETLQQLGFLYSDNENHALGERIFWKPVHQTFLEYLGAYHMAKHLRDYKNYKECSGYDSIFERSPEVLKFCIGILCNKAYKLLDGHRFPVLWKLPINKVLQLLKEAETTPENCRAVAKLLDQTTVEVSTSAVEFEGWSHILSQSFRRLTTIQIAWRIKSTSPDQESSFAEASPNQYKSFFEALKNNESIRTIHVRAKQDGEPFTDEKIAMLFSHLKTAFSKKNLQELFVELKMKASSHLHSAIVLQRSKSEIFQNLRILKLHTFMADKDLMGICDTLQKCAPLLEILHLEGLEHGNAGFQSLVKLLKGSKSINNLHISMNQSLFMNVFESNIVNKTDYAPGQMRTEHQRMNRTAGRRSRHAFSECSDDLQDFPGSPSLSSPEEAQFSSDPTRKNSKENNSPLPDCEKDPHKELSYLFNKLDMASGQWLVEARRHWYLRNHACDLRIPLPVCIEREHKSVFHFLFSAIPDTRIKTLTLSQAGLYLMTADLICLGQAVRKSNHLTTLNLQSLDKVESYLPLLIGMGQSPALSTVNITSRKVVLNDISFEVACLALRNNTSLRNLSLGRWQFSLQNTARAHKHLWDLFSGWQLHQLNLKKCYIDMTDHAPPVSPSSPCTQPLSAFFSKPIESQAQPWRSLKIIDLEGVEIKESSGLVRRGHLILPGLAHFVNLTSLDLSVSEARSVKVDNIAARRLFGLIGSEMKQLVELKLNNWEFCFRSPTAEVGHDLASHLRSCRKLKKIQLENVNETIDETSRDQNQNVSWCKFTFLHQLVSYLPHLEDLSLCYYRINRRDLDHDLASRLGACLHDHWHHTPINVKFFKLSPEVDNIIYLALKRSQCKVERSSGPSPLKIYKVRSILNLKKKTR